MEQFMVIIYFAIFIALLWVYVKQYICVHNKFEKQLSLEYEMFYRWQSILFLASIELRSMAHDKSIRRKTEPSYYKGRIFKKINDPLLELFLKTIIRNKRYRSGYLRLISLTVPFYIYFPWWGDLLLLVVSFFMLKSWLLSVVKELRGHPIFMVFLIENNQWRKSSESLITYLVKYVLAGIFICVLLANLIGLLI